MRATMVRHSVVLATGLISLAVSGCGGNGDPDRSQTAHPAPAGKIWEIDFAAARPSGVKLTPSVVGDGCLLLTDDEIKALLPQAQKVTRGHQFQPGDCTYSVFFPGYPDSEAQIDTFVRGWFSSDGAAAKELARLRRDDEYVDGPRRPDVSRLGADECYDSAEISAGAPSTLTCRKGKFVFSAVAIGFMPLKKSAGDEKKQPQRSWYDHVGLELVKTITAKVP